jgi:hypothetical protein
VSQREERFRLHGRDIHPPGLVLVERVSAGERGGRADAAWQRAR